MTICITGGSGFVGTQLTKLFMASGHSVVVFDIVPPRTEISGVKFFKVDLLKDPIPDVLGECDVVIHLSGVSIFGRWTESYKKAIYDSRILSTRALVEHFKIQNKKPSVFVCASAVGFYGDRGEEVLDESQSPGTDFLAHVCVDWEAEAAKARELGVRVVSIRTGIVLGAGGGMLGTLLPIFRLGIGGPMGSGRQWFSWVHMDDLIKIYETAVLDARLQGGVNAVAPESVRNSELVSEMGKVLHRPTIIPLPGFVLRIIVGQFADAILGSQRIVPTKLAAVNFQYTYPTLTSALAEIIQK